MPMMKCSYTPPLLFSNGHLQTLFPYFFRKVNLTYKRKRITTQDHDFIDIDYCDANSKSLLILSHGLEGSSTSPYILGMAKKFFQFGHDIIAWNMRSCSGELNRTRKFYHSASMDDLASVIDFARKLKKYEKIALIGFSMGGNITANYLCHYGTKICSKLVGAVIFSAPLDLESSFIELQRPMGKLYTESFLVTLRKKVLEKHQVLGLHDLDMTDLHKIKDFYEFDNRFTAPLHGFKNAEDYWTKASPLQHLSKIKLPTLIINAQNDPFLGKKCFPIRESHRNKNLFLEVPASGGHVGFVSFLGGENYWSEHRAWEFLKQCGF